MKEIQTIKTIEGFYESEYKEKVSRFIAQAFPAENEEDILTNLNEAKKKYYNATHYCFAYKLQNDKIRYSDAGEPSGSAGIRILNAIDHFDLSNILVIVIRYFGGTKLGVGPLGKAYYNSAFQTLQKSKIVIKHLFIKTIIETGFNFLSQIMNILSSQEAKISETKYDEKLPGNCSIECLIKAESIEKVKRQINNISKGTAVIKTLESFYC